MWTALLLNSFILSMRKLLLKELQTHPKEQEKLVTTREEQEELEAEEVQEEEEVLVE